mmetsp:Transcript_64260/g.177803  ORF Transcript_64260/g.177803 Transcript_64260/m.177803 type:complete len:307 (+) Transcript_64260:285-1205(+)
MASKRERLENALEQLECEFDDGMWVPKTSGGKQVSPNSMRTKIRKFLAEKTMTQTAWLAQIHVNNNSFGRFMNGSYKNQWSACDNGTYWAAAKFFARQDIQKQIDALNAPKASAGSKRALGDMSNSSVDASSSSSSSGPSKKAKKDAAVALCAAIVAVELPEKVPVFAHCDDIRKAINKFLIDTGVNQTQFLRSIDCAANSFGSFMKLKGKGGGAANKVYHNAYRFLEQYRILEGKPKSAKRTEAEARWGPHGYHLRHDDGKRWGLPGDQYDKSRFDIDLCRDRQNASGSSAMMDRIRWGDDSAAF